MKKTEFLSIAEKSDHCPFIDGWRGIAILLVVAVHSSQYFGANSSYRQLHWYVVKVLDSGARGVQLFYILSAFTLFNSSYRRFKTDAHPKLTFYLRRCFRILPLWWIVVLLFCIVDRKRIIACFLSSTFLFGFVRFDPSLEVVPGGWSLFVEETFYVMLPIIFHRISNLRRASLFTIALMGIAVLWSASEWLGLPIPATNSYVFLFPLNHWYFFGLGIMLYYIAGKERWQQNITAGNKWKWDVAAICAFPAFCSPFLASVGIMFTFCIYVSSCNGTLLHTIMNNKLLSRFGVYCYSIYLLHLLLLRLGTPFLLDLLPTFNVGRYTAELNFLIYYIAVCSILLLVGHFSFKLFEKPCVDLGKTLIRKLEAKTAPIAEGVKAKA